MCVTHFYVMYCIIYLCVVFLAVSIAELCSSKSRCVTSYTSYIKCVITRCQLYRVGQKFLKKETNKQEDLGRINLPPFPAYVIYLKYLNLM